MTADLKQRIEELHEEVEHIHPSDDAELERIRIHYLGKKGILNELFRQFKEVAPEDKKVIGQSLNQLKKRTEEKVKAWQEHFKKAAKQEEGNYDLTRPAGETPPGSQHPVSIVRTKIIDILSRIGFTIAEGPEIEDDWHNFTALNFPPDHPARDMQDTFFVERDPDVVLRTHTSTVQIRELMKAPPPLRVISPGKVFRCDSDATHSPAFHQIEGIYVAEGVGFADLKQTLFFFVREMFGDQAEVRFRPSFFPFTEPSAEMDVGWMKDGKKDWMEILGCGMVDPNVLENCGVDSERYTGFAFGMGVERIAMLKYGIPDLRLFFDNDVRFLGQFRGEV